MQAHQKELTDHEAYELFRRAIAERDEDAWAANAARYRLLLISWAAHCSTRIRINERCEDIADQALARAWVALSPARFVGFPNLAALLAYLRTCVTAVVIDHARSQAAMERLYRNLKARPIETPEQVVLGEFSRAELWRLVNSLVSNEQERTVLVESFVLALPPRAIWARHPDLFPTVMDVYTTKRNLLGRLQRNRDLQELHQELLAA